MSVQDKLAVLSTLDGFAGVGVATPSGESIATLGVHLTDASKAHLQKIAVIANNILISSQKACEEMGVGTQELVHIVTDKAHILMGDLNEGSDPYKTQPGQAHLHLILVLTSDSSIALAKLRMDTVMKSLAEDLRA